jgi:ABC-2 type transport system permease protein
MNTASPAAHVRAPFRATAGLEFAEVLRSRWLLFCFGLYAVLGAVFVFVGMRESNVMGFTGMGRVLFAFCHALTLLLPLLALTATGQTVAQARDDGSLELLFSHPLSRVRWFLAVSLVRLAVLALPLVLLVAALAVYGRLAFGEPVPWDFLTRSMAVSTALLTCFTGIGMLLASGARSQARAMMAILATWALCIALMDFALTGLMLQWRLNPRTVFLLAALNPVQSARLALLSSAEPELAVFGQVGFYLANRVGATGLLLVGILWPLALGISCWLAGLRRFRRTDLV